MDIMEHNALHTYLYIISALALGNEEDNSKIIACFNATF